MNMIRSRSSLTIPPSENAISLSEKSNMNSPPRLVRSSSYRQNDDSPSKMSDDDRGIGTSNQANIPKNTAANISHRYMKWFVLLVFIGAAIYFFIVVYFGALFIRDIDIADVSDTHFEKKNQVTVLINTFKRKDMVHDAVRHYAQCGVVANVYVIWSESTELPADVITRYSQNKYNKVKFLPQPTKSLNNRFRPLDQSLPRTDAIFSTDDDMRVSCDDLERAYSVWRSSSRSIVGFMPRVHMRGPDGTLVYRCWFKVWWLGKYSIILTKVAMFHHDYLSMYSNSMPQSIRDMVDKERNCEDIAMQFLISNVTTLPPIYIKGHLSDLGAFGGISTTTNGLIAAHMDKRSNCLNDLVKIYGKNPLVFSHFIVDSASDWFSNMPSTWQDFISSDLWKF